MRQSRLFTKTRKNAPSDADSSNACLLIKAGFVSQLAAGVYTYLPLGLRVLDKIKNIVREEMNAMGAQEVLMPTLHPKSLYDKTGRWDLIDVMFKLEASGGKEYSLSSTAEEVVTPLVRQFANSYKDFPIAVYQIQDKFRDEPRAKSGLLRGREFSMKDLYSFHLSEESFLKFYEQVKAAYMKVYERCGLKAVIAMASGGVFTQKYSHEFQVETEAGEDRIYIDRKTGEVMNREIVPESDWENTDKYEIKKTIEVGNIFPLETRFSKPFDFTIQGADDKPVDVIMGCYGIGPSRVMGAIVEIHHDEHGIIWPKEVAPFQVHLVSLTSKKEDVQIKINATSEKLYVDLAKNGIEVLWDDRAGLSAGEKFADSDLIGIPVRLVISEKTLVQNCVELKERAKDGAELIGLNDILISVKNRI